MNILIINAFGSCPKAKKRFESFCNLIKNLFKKVSKGTGIDNFNYIYRSPSNLSDFLFKYDMISGDIDQNKKKKKNFDKVDIIMIDGYEKYVPWGNKSSLLCEFIKLCKISNKILYAGGVALEILIYYLATGALNEYNFINAKGQIKSLEEMVSIPNKYMKELKNNDIFLDYVTGDILEYKNNETWVPLKNIGLHKQLTAEKYMNRGKFVLPYRFKGKDYIKNMDAFVTTCNEIKVKITRQYLYHFLLDNLPLEFIATTSLTWYPHFFNVTNKSFQFKVICESDKGPVVIEHENSTGVLFHPNEKYKETVIFLENFIRNKFNEVQNKLFTFKNNFIIKSNNNDIPPIFKYYNAYEDRKKLELSNDDLIASHNNTNLDRVNNSRAFNRIKKVKSEANHVGFGINNRDMVFVENNFINQKPLFYMDNYKKNSNLNLLYNEDMQLNKDNLLLKKMKKNALYSSNINIENKKNSNIEKIKKLNIIINNGSNKEKILKKRNIFMSYNNKKKLNLNNIDNINSKNKKDNIILKSRNLSLVKKKIRIKSPNTISKTMSNNNKKAKTQNNLEYNEGYPLLLSDSKIKRNDNLDNNNEDNDEFYEKYIPKYPRPANIEQENDSFKISDNLTLLWSSNKKGSENNIFCINNNKLKEQNFGKTNFFSKKDYIANTKNLISFNGFSEGKKSVIKTIFY